MITLAVRTSILLVLFRRITTLSSSRRRFASLCHVDASRRTYSTPAAAASMPDVSGYLRPSRGAPAVALAPQEDMAKAMRQPKLPLAAHRPRAVFGSTSSSSTSQSKSGSIYLLLTSGNLEFKLPPLNTAFSFLSRPSSRDSSPRTSTESSPVM